MCRNGWSTSDAEVVCRQLGLPYGNAQPVGSSVFGWGTGQIWLDYVACGSSNNFLDECLNRNYPWGRHNSYCDHSKDAGIVCTNGNGAIMNYVTNGQFTGKYILSIYKTLYFRINRYYLVKYECYSFM